MRLFFKFSVNSFIEQQQNGRQYRNEKKKLDVEDNGFVGENHNENDDPNCSSSTVVIAGTSLLDLKNDCFDHVFQSFSLKELLTLRSVCTRIKSIVDGYIPVKYRRLRFMSINNFDRTFAAYQMKLAYFAWIRHLSIQNIKLTRNRIDSLKSFWSQLEQLEVVDVKMDDDSFDMLLKCCSCLKHLSLITTTSTRIVIGPGFKWLSRRYPTLEHVRIETGARYKCPQLVPFFQRNPNIRIFSTDCKFLSMNLRFMVKSKLKFDRLNLTLDGDFDFIHSLANNLPEQDFYEQLHLRVTDGRWWSEDQSQNLWKLRNIEVLSLSSLPKMAPVPVVESIRKLNIESGRDAAPDILRSMATNFINLERVAIHEACLYDIRSFACHAPKLQQIKVRTLKNSITVIKSRDFRALNEERKNLANACKLTIFIAKDSFEKMRRKATSGAKANGDKATINFSLIVLKRIEMIENEDLFDCT